MRLAFHNDLNICSLSWYSTLMNFVSFLLWSEIKPAGNVSYSWFDAQKQCLHHGLTIEKDKSDQPYWTGVYRRLTPWINILGQNLLFFSFSFIIRKHFIVYHISLPIVGFILCCCFFFFRYFLVCITRIISYHSWINLNVVCFVWRVLFRFNRHFAVCG